MKKLTIGIDISKNKFDAACKNKDQKWQDGTFDCVFRSIRTLIPI